MTVAAVLFGVNASVSKVVLEAGKTVILEKQKVLELADRHKIAVVGLDKAPGDNGEIAAALMKLAWSSPAALAIAPLQDVLNLGNEARMNLPGRADGNWQWRCTDEMLVRASFDWLRDLTRGSGRALPTTNPA